MPNGLTDVLARVIDSVKLDGTLDTTEYVEQITTALADVRTDIFEVWRLVEAHPDYLFGTIFTVADLDSNQTDEDFSARYAKDRLAEVGNLYLADHTIAGTSDEEDEGTRMVRVTEERVQVVEVSYDVPVPITRGTDEAEEYLDRASMEVHRQTIRANYEITNAEEAST